jgi:hypothetical protein
MQSVKRPPAAPARPPKRVLDSRRQHWWVAERIPAGALYRQIGERQQMGLVDGIG